jgi:hypothetical protein
MRVRPTILFCFVWFGLVDWLAVINALCGAGLYSQIGGGFFSGAQVQSSLFSGNGDHNDAAKTWASGIQVGIGSNGFQAQQNYYVDNTDCHVGMLCMLRSSYESFGCHALSQMTC